MRSFAEAEQRACKERPQASREAEDGRARQCVKPPVAQYESGARKLGRDKSIAESQLIAEFQRSLLLNQQCVRARVDRELPDTLGANDAAGPLIALEHENRALSLSQFVRG